MAGTSMTARTAVAGGKAEWRSGGVAGWQGGRSSLARQGLQGQGIFRFPAFLLIDLSLDSPTSSMPTRQSLVYFSHQLESLTHIALGLYRKGRESFWR